MIRKCLLLMLCFGSLSCQDVGEMKFMTDLPSSLREISGLAYDAYNEVFWAINDSGNKAELFALDATGTVVKTIKIDNAKNKDWEDLAISPDGKLFIGDFGNNMNDRKDQAVYIVDTKGLVDRSEVKASMIKFSLSDQEKFPPKAKKRNFDIEAFYYANDSLYLISRNRATKFDGTAKVYRLAAVEGKHEAALISTFVTCDKKNRCQVTAADYHPATNTVAVLAYNRVWLCSDFNGGDLFGGTVIELDLGDATQKESLCFKDANTLYIADEKAGPRGGNFYELKF